MQKILLTVLAVANIIEANNDEKQRTLGAAALAETALPALGLGTGLTGLGLGGGLPGLGLGSGLSGLGLGTGLGLGGLSGL
ncbi:hypothetical protein BLA29_014092, partial [Euroglyphus maynei]